MARFSELVRPGSLLFDGISGDGLDRLLACLSTPPLSWESPATKGGARKTKKKKKKKKKNLNN